MPAEERRRGEELLHVAIKTCIIQHRRGAYFIMEHPQGASSWRGPKMEKLIGMKGVQVLNLDQCEYGLTSQDRWGEAPARKVTRLVTNMGMAGLVLAQRCRGGHRHVPLVNNRAAAAQTYPTKLCEAFVDALRLELGQVNEVNNVSEDMLHDDLAEEELAGVPNKWDEGTGKALDPILVRRGREKELKKLSATCMRPCRVRLHTRTRMPSS